MKSNIAIIGSGLAGMNLVKEIRKHDQSRTIALFTAEGGHFYSKPMLSNALAKGKTAKQLVMQPAEAFAKQYEVSLWAGASVTAIDLAAKTLVSEGKSFQWDTLVLATGAKPLALSDAGVQVGATVHTVNQLSAYANFRQALDEALVRRGAAPVRVGIVGSGLIGCEFANDLIDQGYAVDVLDIAERPMWRLLAPEQSLALAQALADRGVKWHWRHQVRKIEPSSDGCSIITDMGLNLTVDVVLSAIGLGPEVSLAQAVGLEVGPGVVVNQFLQSAQPDVYALGDCATVRGVTLQYVLPLMACVRALAKTLCGQPTPVHYPAMPIVVKTPAYPVVVSLPPDKQDQPWDWLLEGEAPNYKALVKDHAGQVVGFALTGESVGEKNALAKTLPDWLG